MSNILEKEGQTQQLFQYFSSYLFDMSIMIQEVKRLAYKLINVTQPVPQIINISTDITSIIAACKRTFDDLKRTESILKGHVKGKITQSTFNNLQGIVTHKNSKLKKTSTNLSYNDDEATSIKKNMHKPSVQAQSQPENMKELSKQQLPQSWTKIPNQGEQNDDQNIALIRQNASMSTSNPRYDAKQVKIRVQDIRKSRSKQILQIHNGNTQCIDLIKKIKSELKLKRA